MPSGENSTPSSSAAASWHRDPTYHMQSVHMPMQWHMSMTVSHHCINVLSVTPGPHMLPKALPAKTILNVSRIVLGTFKQSLENGAKGSISPMAEKREDKGQTGFSPTVCVSCSEASCF